MDAYDRYQQASEEIDEARRAMRLMPQTAPRAEEHMVRLKPQREIFDLEPDLAYALW